MNISEISSIIMVKVTLILTMETEETSERLLSNSTWTQLIA
jgi:hypothetical protein